MISWLIPTYQTPPEWLGICLQSVLSQTSEGDEIIVIDDGTTDRAAKDALERYSELNPKIRVITVPTNIGVAAALNIGLDLSTQPIIARIDADDWNEPRRIEKQLAYWSQHPCDLLGSAMKAHYPDKTEVMEAYQGSPIDILRKYRTYCFHPSWIINRSTLLNLGGYPTQYPHCEDYALHLLMIRAGMTFGNCPEALVNKRQHTDRVSNRFRDIQRESVKQAFKDIIK